ncbi:TspO/MBR family protein [Devosia faecipullorum]|uniref:TspO/MBR family protein n=1 Tax=Devosia faecipullorum TaxID=2755039 RepID=UPI00187B1D6B|nr:TspO/MBR family protein [Devosia faecipullorum]MBE7734356.1 tryptophan-rich sensory protein [Devosia faecipullorum]
MNIAATDYRSPQSYVALAVFLVLVIGIGALIGTQSVPGIWYENLAKPPLNPPNWIFGPVWFTLYVLIAIAGWRIWIKAPRSGAMRFWVSQMLLNWAWSPIWFLAQQPWLAFVVLVAMWLSIAGFIAVSRKHDALAPILFVPYIVWVSFAGYLNLSIALLN